MAEVSLKLSKRVDQTLWGRAISNIGRVVYSSNFNIYTLFISRKRNNVLKAFPNFHESNRIIDEKKRDQAINKYNTAYSLYIDMLEKYITENIYSKMQKETSNLEEQRLMSAYYEISDLKNQDQVEYKNRLQILLLNMDWSNVTATKSDFYIENYKEFYLYNIQELYKASMRHNAILLANIKYDEGAKYNAIYNLIDTYIREVLPSLPESKDNSQIIKDYAKYVKSIENFEKKDFNDIRKKLALLGFSTELFKFSFPTLAKEQCYVELLNSSRRLLSNYYLENEKYEAYEVILDALEEYVENILVKRTVWNTPEESEEFNEFNEKWTTMKKLARIDYDCYKRQREVLFIKYDTSLMERANIKLPDVKDYYKERLIILHAVRTLKRKVGNICGKWTTRRRQKAD